MVGGCIKLETGVQDRFASYVAGGCSQSGSCRVKSGEHGRTGGGAERTGGVRPIEKHSPFSEAFKIRSFIKCGVAIKSGIGPAQVIGHNKNEVRLSGKRRTKQTKEREGMEEDVLRAGVHGYREVSWMRK